MLAVDDDDRGAEPALSIALLFIYFLVYAT